MTRRTNYNYKIEAFNKGVLESINKIEDIEWLPDYYKSQIISILKSLLSGNVNGNTRKQLCESGIPLPEETRKVGGVPAKKENANGEK